MVARTSFAFWWAVSLASSSMGLAPGVLLHLGEELALGFLGGQPGDHFELPALLLDQPVEPLLFRLEGALELHGALLPALDVLAAAVQLFEPTGQLLLLLEDAALDLLDFPLALAVLLLRLGPRFEGNLLRLEAGVPFPCLRVPLGLLGKPLGVGAGRSDRSFDDQLLDQVPQDEGEEGDNGEHPDQGCRHGHLQRGTHPLRGRITPRTLGASGSNTRQI